MHSAGAAVSAAEEQAQGFATWGNVTSRGEVPCLRSGHEVAVLGNKAYLFGGYGGDGSKFGHLSDFYSYEFETGKWRSLSHIPGGPSARTAFSMCAAPKNFLYIWGGADQNLEGLEDQAVYEFDAHHLQWRRLETYNRGILGPSFFGRSADYHRGRLLFFGGGMKGRGQVKGHFSNELVALDLATLRWEAVRTAGERPTARYKHQTCVVGDALWVTGGGDYFPGAAFDAYVLDLRRCVWRRVAAAGPAPAPRAAHRMEYDPVTRALYVWGGFNADAASLADFHRLDLRTLTWAPLGAGPGGGGNGGGGGGHGGAAFHASAAWGGLLLSFFGRAAARGDARRPAPWGADPGWAPAPAAACRLHQSPAGLRELALAAAAAAAAAPPSAGEQAGAKVARGGARAPLALHYRLLPGELKRRLPGGWAADAGEAGLEGECGGPRRRRQSDGRPSAAAALAPREAWWLCGQPVAWADRGGEGRAGRPPTRREAWWLRGQPVAWADRGGLATVAAAGAGGGEGVAQGLVEAAVAEAVAAMELS